MHLSMSLSSLQVPVVLTNSAAITVSARCSNSCTSHRSIRSDDAAHNKNNRPSQHPLVSRPPMVFTAVCLARQVRFRSGRARKYHALCFTFVTALELFLKPGSKHSDLVVQPDSLLSSSTRQRHVDRAPLCDFSDLAQRSNLPVVSSD